MGIDVELSYLERLFRGVGEWLGQKWDTYGPAKSRRLVRLFPDGAEVRIRQADCAEINLDLRLLNLTRREVRLEEAQLYHVRVGRSALHEPQVSFRARGTTVGPRDERHFRFRVRGRSAEVRKLFRGLDEAQNLYTTPKARVKAKGQIKLALGLKGELWRRFEFQYDQPNLSIMPPEDLGVEV